MASAVMESANVDKEVKDIIELGKDTASVGSVSPSRPATDSPDLPEHAHGLSRNQTPEGSEGESSNDKWETKDFITEMEAEERKMQEENSLEEQRIRKEIEERDEEKELKEKRYKRLMHLLNKSEFYSQFLLKQIETQALENKNKRVKSRSEKDKENSSSEGNSSQESNRRGKKRKAATSKGSRAKRPLVDGKYNIADIIDTETVKENCGVQEEVEDLERAEQPRLFVNGTMRPYQLDGYSWLMTLYENGVNGILGDEMGLGKTIQCIALVCHLVDKGVPGPFLIVGPLSTLGNWMSEFKRFAPSIPTVLYHGGDTIRTEKRKAICKLAEVKGTPRKIYPVIITSFDVVIRDTKLLNRFQWRYICIDEGHRLKNHQCQLTKCLKTFPSSNRLLMTGTPLQNSLSELWSLLNFLMPEIFDSLDVFESWFDISDMMEEGSDEKIVQQEKENQIITTLMKILSPFFLRRVKKDVNLDLPPKRELHVYTPMTALQLHLYEATLKMDMGVFNELKKIATEAEPVEYDERGRPKRKSKKSIDYKAFDADYDSKCFQNFIKELIQAEVSKEAVETIQKTSVLNVKLQNRVMQLRRIVNHPYLLNYPLNEDGSYKVDEEIVKSCGKLQVLDQLLAELKRRGHRVLVFSQMTMMMDIIEDYFTLRPEYKYKRLDGRCKLEERQADIEEYNNDKSFFAFLISTRAGSLGINLASADTVIIYDSDWNPQCDLQAQDRCHRIGQTRPVLVLRFITESSIDERIVDRAAAKRKLEKLIIQSGKFNSGNARKREQMLEKMFDVDELVELLKQRDHERVHNTTTGNIFSKKEIDALLNRSDLEVPQKKKTNSSKEIDQNQELKGVFRVIKTEEEESED